MSNGLMKLSSPSGLMRATGLRGKENFKFSLDGECLLLAGRVSSSTDEIREEILEEATGGKKAKIKKIVISRTFRITPVSMVCFGCSSKASSTRLLLQPNPALMTLGRVVSPVVIEPHLDKEIFIDLTVIGEAAAPAAPALETAFRLYALA